MRFLPAVTLLLMTIAVLPSRADEPAVPKPHPYATRLAQECDTLLASTIKRPYGWAWPDAENTDAAQKLPGRPVAVSLEPGQTPATALLLWYSAQLLNQPKYADAARNVARGVAAAQAASGKFPVTALFGSASAISKEKSAPLSDRASTRAALALLLTVIDGANDDQEVLKRSANRGTKWFLRQQSDSGAWPSFHPPDALPTNAVRIARLDTPDFRDDIYAMLLAYEVLGDPFHRRAAERSIEFLTKVRTGASESVGAGLWESAYTLAGMGVEKMPAFPNGFDLLASRYATQSIFGAWLVLGDGQRLIACGVATESMDKLIQKSDGHWHRRFNSSGESIDPGSADKTPHAFGRPDEQPAQSDDDGLAPTMQSVALAQQLGREKLREHLAAYSTPKQQLAQIISGLADDLIDPENLEAAMKQQEAQLRLLEKSPDPASATKRLWALYRLAKLENRLDNR